MDKPNLQWRPATEKDIGYLARFCDSKDFVDVCYGILLDVETKLPDESPEGYCAYECKHGLDVRSWDYTDTEWYIYCEVQYDANKEQTQ